MRHLTCFSVLYISHKLVIRSRGLIWFKFNLGIHPTGDNKVCAEKISLVHSLLTPSRPWVWNTFLLQDRALPAYDGLITLYENTFPFRLCIPLFCLSMCVIRHLANSTALSSESRRCSPSFCAQWPCINCRQWPLAVGDWCPLLKLLLLSLLCEDSVAPAWAWPYCIFLSDCDWYQDALGSSVWISTPDKRQQMPLAQQYDSHSFCDVSSH